MKYFVSNEKNDVYEITIQDDQGSLNVSADDKDSIASIDQLSDRNTYSITIDSIKIDVVVLNADEEYEVLINGEYFKFHVVDQLHKRLEDMGALSSQKKIPSQIKVDMPGVVIDVKVKENDQVKEGDVLVVVEAMKMQNEITAPADGQVQSLKVLAGAVLAAGDILVVMDYELLSPRRSPGV